MSLASTWSDTARFILLKPLCSLPSQVTSDNTGQSESPHGHMIDLTVTSCQWNIQLGWVNMRSGRFHSTWKFYFLVITKRVAGQYFSLKGVFSLDMWAKNHTVGHCVDMKEMGFLAEEEGANPLMVQWKSMPLSCVQRIELVKLGENSHEKEREDRWRPVGDHQNFPFLTRNWIPNLHIIRNTDVTIRCRSVLCLNPLLQSAYFLWL